jgi:phosphatidylserine decarboxylase
MTFRQTLRQILASEDLNFLLTNRVPRQALTHLMGKLSQIRSPLWTRFAIRAWGIFEDLDLADAQTDRFESLHDFFIRQLRPNARPVDADLYVLSSPCDGIVGATGQIENGQLFQAKGFNYRLDELIGDDPAAAHWIDGQFVTLRIRSSMYHRFHAPCNGTLKRVRYFSGDTWNVNPIALKRVEKLFCKNERALLYVESQEHPPIALIPVAAILVASIRLHAIDTLLHLRYPGPHLIDCDSSFQKGDELGWFQHGSTIIMLTPPGYQLMPNLNTGSVIRCGETLFRKSTPTVS